ncbi:hypothetical protein PVAND_007146 [Polypedilum vanderplanki]|uniref:Cold shock domain-containing protein E1 n=1 Tax=Polypedilum vanderplanki TaxID=319348 RepID=A0A9J6C6Y6_POLVA|nr:hypothetical protein PVAND_007146 [Polypedilum vanderplanki]
MSGQTKPFCSESPFLDFDFSTRELFSTFNQHVNSPAPRLITNNPNNNNNNNNNFPIGTFSIDSLPSVSSNNSIFGNGGKIFNSSSIDNGMTFNSSALSLMNGLNVGSNSNSGGINSHNNNNFGHMNGISSNDQSGTQATGGTNSRETGIIEKLLHSYGFIQCCERQARLFFHFSQFGGNIEHLKIGDPVEFEMTYDKRTGKPIASQVSKIAPEVVHREERVTGTVTTEIRSSNDLSINPSASDTTGRISYENRGECFFLPYTKDDVEGNVQLKAGDKVSFQIATNNRGNLGACHIRLENSMHPVKYRGVVCSTKESFGFIERADVVKEIFFHFSETEGNNLEIRPGDDVEFTIQTRNGKEVACNISRLPPGSVIFEDVDPTIIKGQVLKPLELNNPNSQQSDPLPGRIKYRAQDHSEKEVPYGDKDQKGDFTLRHGDWVQFFLATDRRDQLQRATCISLLDETFQLSGEKREQGVVAQLKDGFGFIRCVERSVRLFFHFTEVLDTSREIALEDEIEFTCVQDPTSSFTNPRLSAIRIKHLPEGTVKFETLIETGVEGVVTREAPKSPVKLNGQERSLERTEGGVITYGIGNNKKTIMYFLKDCDKPPRCGDHVKFNICQEFIATNIQEIYNPFQIAQMSQPIDLQKLFMHQLQQQPPQLISPQQSLTMQQELTMQADKWQAAAAAAAVVNNNVNGNNAVVSVANPMLNGCATMVTNTNINVTYLNGAIGGNSKYEMEKFKMHQGFIAVLKDNFGFIETLEHDQEVFFHFSNFIGNTNHLELGQEVEYSLSPSRSVNGNGGNCIPAENVRLLPRGTIIHPKILDGVYNGVVIRPLRCINPDQEEYSGLIQLKDENGENISQHKFGITSLVNKRDLLQKDDTVVFKIDETSRAVEVVSVRLKKRAIVDSIKGQFGFLDYEVEEGKKLFFHMSEVQGNSYNLYPGDTVEFSIVTNHRTGKTSACGVVKIQDSSPRPDRLISRLKINSVDESSPRLTVTRAPKGPDGTKGFHPDARAPRMLGVMAE